MNKVLYMAVAAAICFSGMLTGCGNGMNKEVVTPLVTETVDYADSLTLGGCRASSSAKVDFPESGDSALVNNLRAWIAGRLVPYNGMTSADNTMLQGMDTVTDGESLVKTACRIALDMAEADFVQFVEDSISTTYEYDYSVAKVYEATTFVSYTSQTYVYSGGAHGGIIASGAVFALADGEQYGWNNMFVADSLDAVRGLIESGLMADYFKVGSREELMNCLMLEPGAIELPLPVMSPVFKADGVEFVYQQYEISSYAAGMPTCTLSYAKLAGMFTPQVGRLLNEAGLTD